jgi:hypothetical protein
MSRPARAQPSPVLDLRRRTLGVDPRHLDAPLVLDAARHVEAQYDDPQTGRERRVTGSAQTILTALWRAGYRVTLREP